MIFFVVVHGCATGALFLADMQMLFSLWSRSNRVSSVSVQAKCQTAMKRSEEKAAGNVFFFVFSLSFGTAATTPTTKTMLLLVNPHNNLDFRVFNIG